MKCCSKSIAAICSAKGTSCGLGRLGRVYFGGANPLGRTFQVDVAPGAQRPTYTIVGLARDTTYNDLRLPFAPEFYAPAPQDPQYPLASLKLVIRSSQTTKPALRRARDILAQVNARVAGVLLNAVNLDSPDYYYYYEYQGKYGQRYYDEDMSGSDHDATHAASTSA